MDSDGLPTGMISLCKSVSNEIKMNHTPLSIVFLFAMFLSFGTPLQAKPWRGIVPLKSTRADVEKALGSPNSLGRYEFENERAYIDYSKGCDKVENCLCLIPKDTVISIFVTLETDLKISDLKIDRRRYKKRHGGHLPSIVTYANDREGIIYTVDKEDGEVMHITYMATTKDCWELVKRTRATNTRSPRRGLGARNAANSQRFLANFQLGPLYAGPGKTRQTKWEWLSTSYYSFG